MTPLQQYTLLLDQSRIIQTTACPNPVGQARNRKTGKWIHLNCKRWDCDTCGPTKVNRLKIRTALGDLRPEWFLTLTLHTSDQRNLMDSFNLFVAGLRKSTYRLRYFCAREFTKQGKRHLHVIGEGWIPYRELSRRWERATGGASKWTHVRPCHDKQHAVRYVTKYMMKSADSRLFEKGERRYSASHGVLWPVAKDPDAWDVFIYKTGRGETADRCYEDYMSWVHRSQRDFEKLLGPPPPADQTTLCLAAED